MSEPRIGFGGHTYRVRYDPDGIWPSMWDVKVYGPDGEYCRTVSALWKARAHRKAQNYIKRRNRRLRRHG